MGSKLVRVLITGAGGTASRNVAASLRLSAYEYWILGVDRESTYLGASGCDAAAIVPDSSDPNYLKALRDLVDEHRIQLLLPQPDREVQVLANAFGARLPTALPPPHVIAITSDKAKTASTLAAAGLDVPRSLAAGSEPKEAWQSIAGQGRTTVWVRARRGAGSRASLPTTSFEEADFWMKYWARQGINHTDFMFSEFLPGREYAVQTLWWHGELVAAQARCRLEYLFGFLSPSGQSSSPSVARIDNRLDVYTTSLSAIKALTPEPHGVFSIDLKCNENDIPCITEVNAGRFFTTSLFLATVGANFPDMLVRLAVGDQVAYPGVAPVAEGVGLWVRSVDMCPMLVPE